MHLPPALVNIGDLGMRVLVKLFPECFSGGVHCCFLNFAVYYCETNDSVSVVNQLNPSIPFSLLRQAQHKSKRRAGMSSEIRHPSYSPLFRGDAGRARRLKENLCVLCD
jgi:hypothetical protein